MSERKPRILVIGYGNRGRGDDGLGPMVADAVAGMRLDHVTVEVAHQLQIEDAATVAGHDAVVFADADLAVEDPFVLEAITPAPDTGLFSHSVSPAAILGLAAKLYGSTCRGWVLAIRGHRFEVFDDDLTDAAQANLAAALATLEPLLRTGSLDALPAADREPAARARGA